MLQQQQQQAQHRVQQLEQYHDEPPLGNRARKRQAWEELDARNAGSSSQRPGDRR
jgi:hypothetical protein